MNFKLLFLWTGILGSIFFAQYLEGGSPSQLIQPTSALLVFGPLLFYGIYFHGPRGFLTFSGRVFKNRLLSADREFVDRLMSLGFLCGAVGMVLGMIHVMSHLSDSSTIGAGVSVAIVSAIYGVVPALLLLPLKPHELKVAKAPKEAVRKAAGYATLVVLLSMFSLITVLWVLGATA